MLQSLEQSIISIAIAKDSTTIQTLRRNHVQKAKQGQQKPWTYQKAQEVLVQHKMQVHLDLKSNVNTIMSKIAQFPEP